VNRRLAEGGIFLQWVQAYAIDGQTLLTIMATLAQVFPSVEIWRMAPSDLLLVATRTELVHDVAQTRARMRQEPYRAALLGAWSTVTLEGVLAHHVARPSLVRRVADLQGQAINTDDRTRVEFGFARSLTGTGNLHAGDIEALADKLIAMRDDPHGTEHSTRWFVRPVRDLLGRLTSQAAARPGQPAHIR